MRPARTTRRLLVLALLACAFPGTATARDHSTVGVQGTPVLEGDDLTRACTQAAQLVEDGNLADAETLYRSLLGRADCAADGLEDVAAAKKAAADETTADAETPAKFDERVAAIRALQREGFDTEARAELKKLVTDFPTSDIPKDLRDPTQQLGQWRQLLGTIGPPVVTGLEILAVGIGLILAYALVGYCLRRWRKTVQLAGFGGSDKTLEAALPSALNDHLARLREDGSGPQLMSQSAVEADFAALPATVVAAVPQANLVTSALAAIDKLVPRNILDVTGTARPVDPTRGAGLTIKLSERDGRTIAQQTVWESEYLLTPAADQDLATRYARLLAPAAVWLAYRSELGYDGTSPPLDTTSWRSYALFAAGDLLQREHRTSDARKAFEAALDDDGANLGALLNLGALMLTPPAGADGYPHEDADDVATRLQDARSLIGRVTRRADNWTRPLVYRAHYLAAVADLYAELPDKAIDHICELKRRLREQQCNEDLRPLLRGLEPAVEALYQGARVHKGCAPDLCWFQGGWVSAGAEYNLACVYNGWADMAVRAGDRKTRRRTALEHLATAIERQPGMRADAKLDAALQSIRADTEFTPDWDKLVKDPTPAAKLDGDRGERVRDALRELIAAATSV